MPNVPTGPSGSEQQGDFQREAVVGRVAVEAALKGDRPLDCLMVDKSVHSGALQALAARARTMGLPIKTVSREKLDFLCPGVNHQGVAVLIAAHAYAEVEDILAAAARRGEPPLIVICELEDPHNLGAVIRTAEAVSAHGVIIPKRRSVSLTGAVAKAACGALESLPVARVTNLTDTVRRLKEQGLWVYGADARGTDWCAADYAGGAVLVIGSEGEGISRLLRETCDLLVALPMYGQVTSLNASVAAGVILYEMARQRRGLKALAPQTSKQ